jgi:hypothetical protein
LGLADAYGVGDELCRLPASPLRSEFKLCANLRSEIDLLKSLSFYCVASVAEIQWFLAFGFFAQKSSIWSNNLLASQPPSLR